MNNVVYYAFFDTAINACLIKETGLDAQAGSVIAITPESFCQFHASIAYPAKVEVGLAVSRLGRSSVRYEIGIFEQGQEVIAASGYFVHVFVDRQSMRPVEMPEVQREGLSRLRI